MARASLGWTDLSSYPGLVAELGIYGKVSKLTCPLFFSSVKWGSSRWLEGLHRHLLEGLTVELLLLCPVTVQGPSWRFLEEAGGWGSLFSSQHTLCIRPQKSHAGEHDFESGFI